MRSRHCLWAMLLLSCTAGGAEIVVGSKAFTESVILGEVVRHAAVGSGHTVEHRRELGGTRILWSALMRGDIDVYPEYTGTLLTEILNAPSDTSSQQLAALLSAQGVRMSAPLGFNNTYVIGMRRADAQRLGIARVSDLRSHPQLRIGFTNEFLQRADGWPGLKRHYGLTHEDVRGLQHELAYRGLVSGSLDVIDLYSTDAEIREYDIATLTDDLAFFPRYDAVLLYRPEVAAALAPVVAQLAGRLDEQSMIRLNARVKLDRIPETAVASEFLGGSNPEARRADDRWRRIGARTLEHLWMVGVSLLAAITLALPLGIAAWKHPPSGRALLAISSVLQTLPALALLVFLIPWFGVGYAPAMLALFLYSLLPILRNTQAGLASIDRPLIESATAMGLPPAARLRHVELLLALPVIIAGIKTAAVINIGTATLGALVGAGGYGQPILTGIRLDDMGMIMEGAIPAAALALAVQGLFGLIERSYRRI